MADNSTETGVVKWFDEGKGFGFIAPERGGKDLFAHFKEIRGDGFRSLSEGQRVEFEVTQGQKGPQASNSTRWPSVRLRKPSPRISLKCAKRSLPPRSGAMKPKPLPSLNHFTTPVSVVLSDMMISLRK